MMKTVNKSAALTVLVSLLLPLWACASVNKSITIDAGETSDGATTVNGKISVGAGATVTGDVTSVNGSIRIEEGAKAKAYQVWHVRRIIIENELTDDGDDE